MVSVNQKKSCYLILMKSKDTSIHELTRPLKVLFATKISGGGYFFLTHREKKTVGPESLVIEDIWRVLTFEIDLHPPGTLNPQKNAFLLQQDYILGDLVCLVVANVKTVHLFSIIKFFGPMVFCFSVGSKKSFSYLFCIKHLRGTLEIVN